MGCGAPRLAGAEARQAEAGSSAGREGEEEAEEEEEQPAANGRRGACAALARRSRAGLTEKRPGALGAAAPPGTERPGPASPLAPLLRARSRRGAQGRPGPARPRSRPGGEAAGGERGCEP